MDIRIDRLAADLEALGRFGATADGGVSRTSFSQADRAAREWLTDRCAEAGLALRTDGVGNLFARLEGPPGAAVWTGSHLDSVPNGGRYDGALGVLTSLECLRRLAEEQVPLTRPVELVVFADEEGNYHQLFGSHAAVRGFDRPTLEGLVGRDGDRVADALASLGLDLDGATRTAVDGAGIHAFVELHIEQGAVLQSTGCTIGIVTSIVGLGSGAVTILGRADHAGTTPMRARRDALRGAAAFVLGLPDVAGGVSEHAVVTCGRLAVHPGGDNVVPGRVDLRVDYRDPDPTRLAELEAAIAAHATDSATAHDLDGTFTRDSVTDPVPLSADIQEVIEQAARTRDCPYRRMPSGAGHDSQLLATIVPTGMIFVPSVDGRSHSPAEYTGRDDIEVGANVLLETLRLLATARTGSPR